VRLIAADMPPDWTETLFTFAVARRHHECFLTFLKLLLLLLYLADAVCLRWWAGEVRVLLAVLRPAEHPELWAAINAGAHRSSAARCCAPAASG
jgi:hypothetical protein